MTGKVFSKVEAEQIEFAIHFNGHPCLHKHMQNNQYRTPMADTVIQIN